MAIHPYCTWDAPRGLGTGLGLLDYRQEVGPVNTWVVVGSAAVVTAVAVALLAGKDDIRRFWQIRNM